MGFAINNDDPFEEQWAWDAEQMPVVVLKIIFGRSHHQLDNIHPAYVLLAESFLQGLWLKLIFAFSFRRSDAYVHIHAFCYCWIMEHGWTLVVGKCTEGVEVERYHNNKP